MMNITLTTSDNKYDPFTDFDKWYEYDTVQNNYNTLSLLYRIARTSSEVPQKVNDIEIERAIDFIIDQIPLNTSNKNAFYVKAIKGKTKFPLQINLN